jgi:collagenase-like PrtC family protease
MNCKQKLSVGYFLPERYSLCECLDCYGAHVKEVYFPVRGIADGRGISLFYESDESEMFRELQTIQSQGIKLNMLFNANCYGDESLSKAFSRRIRETIEKVLMHVELSAVTTSSLFVASVIKETHEKLDVRASVNMNIGSINEVRYVEDYFDSFCVARNLNRNKQTLKRVSDYIHSLGKKVSILVNSGCLLNCSAHTFHDNLVAHEDAIVKHQNTMSFKGICWSFYARHHTVKDFVENSSWLLPEQIGAYADVVDTIKLATRTHKNPGIVIEAYAQQEYGDNILELMEPDFSSYGIIKSKDVLL